MNEYKIHVKACSIKNGLFNIFISSNIFISNIIFLIANKNLTAINNSTRHTSRSGLNVFRNVTDRMADYFTEDDSTLEIKTLSYDLNSMVSISIYVDVSGAI